MAPFRYEPQVLDGLVPGGLYVLRGPRRTGKSTVIKRTIERLLADGTDPRSIVFLPVEGWSWSDLEEAISHVAHRLPGRPGQGFWFIDEVTAVEGPWSAAVKRMRDLNLEFAKGTVVLSGSSTARFEEATKHLAGRRGRAVKSDRVLLQMPFIEVAGALGVSLQGFPLLSPKELADGRLTPVLRDVWPWIQGLQDAWEVYLATGGYPQALADYVRTGRVDRTLLDALFDVVHGDALARHHLPLVGTTSILRSITRSLTSRLSVNSVAASANVPYTTAVTPLEDLRRSFLAFPVLREQGLAPKPGSMAKWYFTDPLLARLASIRGAGQAPQPAQITEQQFGVALLRCLERLEPSAAVRHDQLLYHRSSTGAEIDFVAHEFGGVCFESKYVDRNWGRAFQTITASPYKFGVVATRSGEEERPNGWAVPVSLLIALLGG